MPTVEKFSRSLQALHYQHYGQDRLLFSAQVAPDYDVHGAEEWSRTTDTRIFSPLLYHLSYLGISDILGFPHSSVKPHALGGWPVMLGPPTDAMVPSTSVASLHTQHQLSPVIARSRDESRSARTSQSHWQLPAISRHRAWTEGCEQHKEGIHQGNRPRWENEGN